MIKVTLSTWNRESHISTYKGYCCTQASSVSNLFLNVVTSSRDVSSSTHTGSDMGVVLVEAMKEGVVLVGRIKETKSLSTTLLHAFLVYLYEALFPIPDQIIALGITLMSFWRLSLNSLTPTFLPSSYHY